MTNSAIGVHALQNPDGLGDLERAGSLLTVSVDNAGIVDELHHINPAAIAIYRMFTPDISVQEGWRDRRDPREYANWYVNQFRSQLDANRAVLAAPNTYIIGGNEPVLKVGNVDDTAGLVWLSLMEAERCRIMSALGFRCCVFNFPTGFPSIGSWALFKEAYATFKQYGAIVGIHGYYTNPPEPENAFRHEQIFSVMDVNGGSGLRIAYTEWGRVDYRLHASDDQYLSEIVSADNRMRQYPRVVGFALYTLGGTTTWDNYRPTPNLISKLAAYLKTQSGPAVPPPVVVPPVTPPATTTNLLTNPDLFTGGFHVMPGHLSTNVGNGWDFHAEEGIGPDFPDSPHDTAWGVPNAVYHSIDGRPGTTPLPVSEHALYFNPANPVVWHLSLRYGKQWWKLSKTIPNLPAGAYQFSGELYPDIYTGNHVWATDPKCGQWIASLSNVGPAVSGRGNFGKWNSLLSVPISHPGGDLTLTLEAVAPFGVEVVGWFVRGLSLVKVSDPVPPTPPVITEGKTVIIDTKALNVRSSPWDLAEPPIIVTLPIGTIGIVVASLVTVTNGGKWGKCVFWSNGRLWLGWVNVSFLVATP